MSNNYNPNITYYDLPLEDHGYIKQQMVDLTLATFDKNPQSDLEWESIISSKIGWVCVLGKDSVRVNLNKFGADRIWITIDRISPTELDAHVVERIAGIDNQVL
jgi:hypothetical protein